MNHSMRMGAAILLFVSAAGLATAGAPEPCGPSRALPAYAHNDHRNTRPVDDALSLGYRGVEADVFFRDGRFLLGHARSSAAASCPIPVRSSSRSRTRRRRPRAGLRWWRCSNAIGNCWPCRRTRRSPGSSWSMNQPRRRPFPTRWNGSPTCPTAHHYGSRLPRYAASAIMSSMVRLATTSSIWSAISPRRAFTLKSYSWRTM